MATSGYSHQSRSARARAVTARFKNTRYRRDTHFTNVLHRLEKRYSTGAENVEPGFAEDRRGSDDLKHLLIGQFRGMDPFFAKAAEPFGRKNMLHYEVLISFMLRDLPPATVERVEWARKLLKDIAGKRLTPKVRFQKEIYTAWKLACEGVFELARL